VYRRAKYAEARERTGGRGRGLMRTRNGSESSVPAAYSAKSKAAPVLTREGEREEERGTLTVRPAPTNGDQLHGHEGQKGRERERERRERRE